MEIESLSKNDSGDDGNEEQSGQRHGSVDLTSSSKPQTACKVQVSQDNGCLSSLLPSFCLFHPIKLCSISTVCEEVTQLNIDFQRNEARKLSSLQIEQDVACVGAMPESQIQLESRIEVSESQCNPTVSLSETPIDEETQGNGSNAEMARHFSVVNRGTQSISLLSSQQTKEQQDSDAADERSDVKKEFEKQLHAYHDTKYYHNSVVVNERQLNDECTNKVSCPADVAHLQQSDDKVTEIEKIEWNLPDVKCMELCGDENKTERIVITTTAAREELVNQKYQQHEGSKEDQRHEEQRYEEQGDDKQGCQLKENECQSDQMDRTECDKEHHEERQGERQKENWEKGQAEGLEAQYYNAGTEEETGNSNRQESKGLVDKHSSHKCNELSNNLDSGISNITDDALLHLAVTVEDQHHLDQESSKESIDIQSHNKQVVDQLADKDTEPVSQENLVDGSVSMCSLSSAGFISIENIDSGVVGSSCSLTSQYSSKEEQNGSVVTNNMLLIVSHHEPVSVNNNNRNVNCEKEENLENTNHVGRNEGIDTEADACMEENVAKQVVAYTELTSQNGGTSLPSANKFVEKVVHRDLSTSQPTVVDNDKLSSTGVNGEISSPYQRNVMLNTQHVDSDTSENNVRCDVLLVSANADDDEDVSQDQISHVDISENLTDGISMCLSPASQEPPFGSEMMLLPCLGSSPFDGHNFVNEVAADNLNILCDGGDCMSVCNKSHMPPPSCMLPENNANDSCEVSSDEMEVENAIESIKMKQETDIKTNCNVTVSEDSMISEHKIWHKPIGSPLSRLTDNQLQYSECELTLNVMTNLIASNEVPNNEQSECEARDMVNEVKETGERQNESSHSESREHQTAVKFVQKLPINVMLDTTNALANHQSDTELHSRVACENILSSCEHGASDVISVCSRDQDQLVPSDKTVMEEITSVSDASVAYDTDREDAMNEFKTCSMLNEAENDSLADRLLGNTWSEIEGGDFEHPKAKRMKVDEEGNTTVSIKPETSQDACNREVTNQCNPATKLFISKPCFPQDIGKREKSGGQPINQIRLRLGLSKRQKCRRLHGPNEDSMY